jgi:hypothetical protein
MLAFESELLKLQTGNILPNAKIEMLWRIVSIGYDCNTEHLREQNNF